MIDRYITPEMVANETVSIFDELLDPELAERLYIGTWLGYQACVELGGSATVSEIEGYVDGAVDLDYQTGIFVTAAAVEIVEGSAGRVVSEETYQGLRRVLAYASAGMTPNETDQGLAALLGPDLTERYPWVEINDGQSERLGAEVPV